MNVFATPRRGTPACLAIVAAFAVGCSAPASSPPKTTTTGGAPHAHDPGDHNHARGKTLLASGGKYNALLTSHLSAKDGNELDVFVEDKDGPYALDVKELEAVARVGDGDEVTVPFSCAPAHERPRTKPTASARTSSRRPRGCEWASCSASRPRCRSATRRSPWSGATTSRGGTRTTRIDQPARTSCVSRRKRGGAKKHTDHEDAGRGQDGQPAHHRPSLGHPVHQAARDDDDEPHHGQGRSNPEG